MTPSVSDSAAPVKDKELQPLLAQVIPMMTSRGHDHVSIAGSQGRRFTIAWYHADGDLWHVHLTLTGAGAEREVDHELVAADAGELRDALAVHLAALRDS